MAAATSHAVTVSYVQIERSGPRLGKSMLSWSLSRHTLLTKAIEMAFNGMVVPHITQYLAD